MKRSFFQAAVVSILLYGCTTWMLTKRLEKKLDANYTRMLWAILNKSWRQLPTRHQLYGHLPPITKTFQVRRTRRAGHCWRSKDELMSDVLRRTPVYGWAKAGRPDRTYIQCCILTFDPAKQAIPKTVEVTHSDGSYGKKSRRRAWLTIWDKVKSHSTVINWCTGREWPVNCMTVISAWWRSNMPFQRYWVGDWAII